MALFEYKAVTPSGETLTGEMDAPSKALVIAHLQEAGNIPVSAREVGTGFRLSTLFRGRRGLKQSEVGDLTQQLSTLLGAGLALDRSLGILAELAEDDRIGRASCREREERRAGAGARGQH